MRVVVRSVHEELVERLKEGLYHINGNSATASALVSHYLSIRVRSNVRRISL